MVGLVKLLETGEETGDWPFTDSSIGPLKI